MLPLCLIGKCHWVPQEADSETMISLKKAYQYVLLGLTLLDKRKKIGWGRGRKKKGEYSHNRGFRAKA